ncbi:MAG: N-acetylglucosamine-6-sulfatase [Solirubrobacteraceae bacterium]|jgi:arylsulfatase A-like enzyme|nr:N-acetylglucosamine-6-sulfatase [Solirubrobacteraceae bacterium]
MNRRGPLVIAALAAALLAGCGDGGRPQAGRLGSIGTPGPVPAPADPATHPNVVFVLTDDLSTDLLDYMPSVRELQREGLSFNRYIVSNSLCCPSRATIFTGEYPHNTGVFTNVRPDGGLAAFHKHHDGPKSFAIPISQAGYRTALLGKYLNGYAADRGSVPRGWTDWAGSDNGYSGFNYTLDEDGTPVRYGSSPADYTTDVLATRAQAFIANAARDQTPFVLEVSTFAPHFPAVAAPQDQAKYADSQAPRGPSFNARNVDPPKWLADRRKLNVHRVSYIDARHRDRARSVQAVDRMIVALREQLRTSGLEDNTYFVFSSDNGYHMGQHRLAPGKLTAFDSDIRVPLVVVGPGVAAGSTTDALAQNTDLAPTFTELAGAPVPATVDGRSLVPFLRGDTPPDWRTAALIEHHHVTGSDDTASPDRQTALSGNPPDYKALRLATATYVEYRTGEREYYDLDSDPDERVNAYATLSAAQRQALHDQLTALSDCQGAQACSTAR